MSTSFHPSGRLGEAAESTDPGWCELSNPNFNIFLNDNVSILFKLSLIFVPKGPTNNIPALVQIMAWCRSGNKPLSEPMLVSLLMHICITQPQWDNSLAPWRFEWNLRYVILRLFYWLVAELTRVIVLRWLSLNLTDDNSTLVQVMACNHQATSHYLN